MSSHYGATAGALELGVLAAGCLWGVSCGQVWHYYHHCSEDALWIKLIVFGAWLFDTVDQGLITYSLYYYTVQNFTNPDALQMSVPELAIQTAFQGITAFLVQIFFAWRIWKLSEKNKGLATLVVSVIIVQLGLILANTVGNYKALTFDNLSQYNQLAAPIAIGISVGADLLISGLLCYYLYHGRSQDNAPSTNHIIDKLIVFSVSTGALTSMCAIALLIVLLKMPETFIWVGLFFVLGRLYMNSLMAALNMRNTMRRRWTAPPVSGRSFSVHLTANPNDEVMVSPTEYALKELQSPAEAISSKV